ncbi:hypothetical protein [Streptomyces sp. NPDC126499]|uniref:hypothetical protein n=1 Tax=Streptomyces sp. NPDC126499 TaxID=3155314 RepID=UPI00333389ED
MTDTATAAVTVLLAATEEQGPGDTLRIALLVSMVGAVLLAWFLLRGYGKGADGDAGSGAEGDRGSGAAGDRGSGAAGGPERGPDHVGTKPTDGPADGHGDANA